MISLAGRPPDFVCFASSTKPSIIFRMLKKAEVTHFVFHLLYRDDQFLIITSGAVEMRLAQGHNEKLEQVQSAKYLGITTTDNLDRGQHVSEISCKATWTVGFLRRYLALAP